MIPAHMAYVLVVDDEAGIRWLLTRWLSSWGYAAKEVANADAAIEIMAVEPAEILERASETTQAP